MKFFASVCAGPTNHQQYLASMFGTFPFERTFCLHGHFLQLVADLRFTADKLHDYSAFLEHVANDPKVLLNNTDDLAEFLTIDFTLLKHASLKTMVSPPGFKAKPEILEIPGPQDTIFCEYEDCECRFSSTAQYYNHLRHHHHDFRCFGSFAATNCCPFCSTCLSSRNAARAHVRNMMKN